MSVTDAANIPAGDAANNAAESAVEHTPDEVKIDPPESEDIPDPTDGDSAKDDATDMLASFADRLVTLEDAVKGLQKPDEVPVKKKPWTKRGGKK